jgi:lactate dehydrogenase-like 2-hydroxyacid dehydrogenase
MSKPTVYVTRQLPLEAMEYLKDYCDVVVNEEDKVLSKEELIRNIKGKDAVLCLLTDKIDDDVLAAAGENCKIFANYAVGFNNIDIEAATKRGIIVTNTPGVLDDATADLAWTLLFSTSRRVVEADKFMRSGRYKGWAPLMYIGRDVTKKTLGIVGAGRIGANFAKKSIGFEMTLLYTDIKRNYDFEKETGAKYVDKETLLRESDFVSIHIPLFPSTKHYISDAEFKLMKETAILINTARGPIVDEKALVRALKNGEIWGAGLDVFEEEPLMEKDLENMENVVVLPHIASATIETRTNMGLIAVKNIVSVLSGKKPQTCVNTELLK